MVFNIDSIFTFGFYFFTNDVSRMYYSSLPLTTVLLAIGITKAGLLGQITDSLIGLGIGGMIYGAIYGLGHVICK